MPIVAVRVAEAGSVEVADRMAEHARVEDVTISDKAPPNAALVKMKLLHKCCPSGKSSSPCGPRPYEGPVPN